MMKGQDDPRARCDHSAFERLPDTRPIILPTIILPTIILPTIILPTIMLPTIMLPAP